VFSVGRVKVILDTVVRAARQFFSDVGPLVAKTFMEVKNFLFFFFIDWSLVDARIQMVVPSIDRQDKTIVRIT